MELKDESALKGERIRQVGGGRKSAFETIAGLDEAFFAGFRASHGGFTNRCKGQVDESQAPRDCRVAQRSGH